MRNNHASYSFLKGLLCLGVTITSCQVTPKYCPTCVSAPGHWKAPQAEPEDLQVDAAFCLNNWWTVFEDCELNRLEEYAISNNPTLSLAMANIEEAWSIASIARSFLYPTLDVEPNYQDTGRLFKIYLPPMANNAPNAGVSPFNFLNTPYRIHQYQYTLPFNLSYEIDLWGKNRKQYEAATLNVQAQQEAFYVALLNLTTNVASAYFNMKTLVATRDLYQKVISTFRNDYTLSQSRYTKGLENSLFVTTSYDSLAQAESNYYDILAQIQIQENLLGALLGLPASEFCLEVDPLTSLPPSIPAGIPSTILIQRPDIAQAERAMEAQHAQYGSTYATLFPSVSLTGTLGYLSPDAGDFLRWISRLWAFSIDADQTLFDGGRKMGNVHASWAQFKEATASYQQTVITAFREVEDALSRIEFSDKQINATNNALRAAKQTLSVSQKRYQKGLTNSNETITNERSELNVELNYINLVGQKYQSTLQLIKALGGSWTTCTQD